MPVLKSGESCGKWCFPAALILFGRRNRIGEGLRERMNDCYGNLLCPYEKLARGALAGGHEAALREVEKLDFDPHPA